MTYLLDGAVTALGAVLDREECRKVMVCNTCSAIKAMVPATQVVVVVADHYVVSLFLDSFFLTLFFTTLVHFQPPNVRSWDKYQVAKRVFLNDNEEDCFQLYHCHLDIKHPNEL